MGAWGYQILILQHPGVTALRSPAKVFIAVGFPSKVIWVLGRDVAQMFLFLSFFLIFYFEWQKRLHSGVITGVSFPNPSLSQGKGDIFFMTVFMELRTGLSKRKTELF